MKGRSLPDLRFHPDASSVAFHNLFADRQSDAGTGILLPAVKPLKDDEDALGVLRGNANAVVLTEKVQPLPFRLAEM